VTSQTLVQQGVSRPPTRDIGILVIALLAVSTSGPLIAATAVPALAIAFWRNGMASIVLAPIVLLRRRQELVALDGREWGLALLAGLLLALHFATWIPALNYTSVASATALVATQPVWSALISKVRGQVVARQVWVGIAVALAGALLLTGADLQVSGKALVGDALALLGGVFAAAYMTAGSEVRRSVSTTTYTALCYTTTALLLLVACVVGGQDLSGYDGKDWLKLVALTAGAQLLGHSLFNVVLKTTSPTVVSLSILFEIPGAAIIAALFVKGQHVPLLAVPAAVLLVAGLALVIRATGREAAPSVPVE
jgi:drug/metabolite transporter (DMT)-like permease